ncbi:MAG: ABC transporter substrate-binding protein [Alphaproteobacteria bacterium]
MSPHRLELDRRTALVLGGGAALSALVPGLPAHAAQPPRHGMSVFGELKYGPDFKHFAYANAKAPKGGRLVFTAPSWAYNQNPQTFNTLNGYVLRGDAPPRIGLIFESMMASALDEPDSLYGLVAQSVTASDDGNRFDFRLREGARFHDGTPLQAADVAFSLALLKEKGHPNIAQTMREFVSAEVLGPRDLSLRFSGSQGRQLPLFIASLPIFSKAYYTANEFSKSTLEPPLGSGPYRVGKFEPGRYIEYERVADYWGANLPVNVGQNNFDVIRLEFFRDRQVAFEALKSGVLTVWEEFTSKNWAKGYDFPAIKSGMVKRQTFPDDRPSGAQGFFFNLRRDKFSDPRVREALGLAFDFEWSNKNLFFGLYTRTQSFFENSAMKANGPPPPDELALLEPFRGQVPNDVFEVPYSLPTSNGSGQDRGLLRRASALLKDAGYLVKDGVRQTRTGEAFEIEFLSNSKAFERIILPFIKNLKILGIVARFRLVDPAQYRARLDAFDFDITTRRYSMSSTPGPGIRQFWGSAAADIEGSNNLSGIKNPAVDALIEKIIAADNRTTLNVAARALDRVLRAGRYWVPQWYKPVHTMAVWDKFGWPAEKPRYGFPLETLWWLDKPRAKKLNQE